MKQNYQKTIIACFIGYIVQAIVNNFVPLLFVTFQNSYQISLSRITALISINFAVQLIVDMLSAGFIRKVGYRAAVIFAHICSALGLILLTILPEVMPNAFIGIIISVIAYAIGGGLIEVIISPIVEACPTDNKEKAMSLLHSFYCWGYMGVVLISTAFFAVCGIENWKVITLIWAMVPIINIVLFSKAPIFTLEADDEKGLTIKQLFSQRIFAVLMLMMLCAGASEQVVSQWASAFAEKGLGVSKTVGDLAGPMAFAMMMGISRLIYGKYGHKIDLDKFIKYSCILCITSYLCIALVPVPLLGLVGCALCGFSVGILWPGTYSKSAAIITNGGTLMFAMLALAGDLGCSAGPALAGIVSGYLGNNLHMGILCSVVFPIVLLLGLSISKKVKY